MSGAMCVDGHGGCSVLTFWKGNKLCFQSRLWDMSEGSLKRKRPTPRAKEWWQSVTEGFARLMELCVAEDLTLNQSLHSYKNPKLGP